MKNTGKKRRYESERGKGNGYKPGRERFAGVQFHAERMLKEVGRACDAWLAENEEVKQGFQKGFHYGKKGGRR